MKTFLTIVGILFTIVLLICCMAFVGLAWFFLDEEIRRYFHEDEVLRHSRNAI